MDPSSFSVQGLGACYDVVEEDEDVGICECRVHMCEILSAFLASGVSALRVLMAFGDEIVEVPVVHVGHHDPEAMTVLDVGRRSNRRNAEIGVVLHLFKNSDLRPDKLALLLDILHGHVDVSVPLAQDFALKHLSEGAGTQPFGDFQL